MMQQTHWLFYYSTKLSNNRPAKKNDTDQGSLFAYTNWSDTASL